MLGGATLPEVAFAAMLIILVLVAPLVPRFGAAVGRLFEKKGPGGGGAG